MAEHAQFSSLGMPDPPCPGQEDFCKLQQREKAGGIDAVQCGRAVRMRTANGWRKGNFCRMMEEREE